MRIISHFKQTVRNDHDLGGKIRYFLGLACMLLVCGLFAFEPPRSAMPNYSDYTYSNRHSELILFRSENSQLRSYCREVQSDLQGDLPDLALTPEEQREPLLVGIFEYNSLTVLGTGKIRLLDANPVRAGPRLDA